MPDLAGGEGAAGGRYRQRPWPTIMKCSRRKTGRRTYLLERLVHGELLGRDVLDELRHRLDDE